MVIFMEYSWVEYYRRAYEAEKKKNTVLAGKVADAEGKREELGEKYRAIRANPLYKMSQVSSLFARGYGKARHIASVLKHGGKKEAAPEGFAKAYQERLYCQRDSYSQWIREEEPLLRERYREALAAEKGKRRRSCLVVPYQRLSGIRELSSLMESTADGKGGDQPDILLFADRPGELDEQAVFYVEEWLASYPDTKLLYGAEDHISGGKRCFPWFKPCWSPDTLLGFFYFGSWFAVDRAWAEGVSLSGHEDVRLNLYDFVLRLLKPYFVKPEAVVYDKDKIWRTGFYYGEDRKEPNGDMPAPEIAGLDLVLYHRNSTADFEMPADREYYLETGKMRGEANPEFWGYEKEFLQIKQDFLKGAGCESFPCQTLHPEVWSPVPEYTFYSKEGTPAVSVVILSKDHPELLQNCIRSFLERTYLPGLRECVEFIVVDNGSSAENRQTIEGFLESVKAEVRYLYQPMDFNFSAMCNAGEREARGEFILLLNDDVEIIERNWLRIMLGQASLPGTGAVGAKLWYPKEERIQHAGVTNMHIGPSHKLTTFPDDRIYYYGYNAVTYDMIAVTAACLLVRRSVYGEVGGLDEEMAVSYNDVDLCFKLAEAGYRNVLRNDAVLLHHESASRGLDDLSEEKWYRLIQEKTNLYEKHPQFHRFDPYYNEQLTDNAPDYHIGYKYPYERLLLTAVPEKKEGKEVLQRVLTGAVMLTVERAGKQHKIYLEEPDILEAEGWCYMLWQDNSLFERWLILEAEQGDFYYRIPVKERLRPDVEEILPQQKNIALSGFVCRVLREDIAAGSYKVGMLYRDVPHDRLSYQRSDVVIRSEE